jgi:kynurenine formamidase
MTEATGATRALRVAAPGPECCEGAPHGLTTAHVLGAVQSVREGRIYDLSRVRFRGMPLPAMHPPFEIMTYRSPRGLLVGNEDGVWPSGEQNPKQVGFITEMVMTCMHVGTHVDSLAHITVGEDAAWFGGHCVAEHLGDFGPTHADASTLPPMVTRGVLLDIARHRGVEALPASAGVDADELRAVMATQGVEVRAGDVVLIRTGFGSVWPDTARIPRHAGAGITEDAARLLADAGVIAVGADTEAVEQLPSAVPGNPHPVHTLLLVERGVPLIEMLDLELVAADDRHEFLFVGLPTKIRGATGAMFDPVAIV